MKSAVYPGTFDPITNGHLDLISRSLPLFDKVIVAVAANDAKKPFFSLEERVKLIRESTGDLKGVEVVSFHNLVTDFCRENKVDTLIRGLRAISDFEYELQMSQMNRKLNDDVETVFLMPSLEYTFISSKLIKEVAEMGGNISCLVPPAVEKRLKERFKS